ncbi:hypothetical protein IFM89_010890 [Coptis chinensis]|uniref:ZF-HD dimerization-type domain-containing protein n=1 Tax=Coptis chinensis TaxID=261450 RepID=A0A835I427_9MAGN|nr:hypothetical protein IFM89_010890 [Coptis chinensis]
MEEEMINNEVYKECQKNHAAGLGKYVTDGCNEYVTDGSKGNGKFCQACGCHQSFHRKVSVQEKIRQDVIDLPENEIDHSDASNTNTRAVTLKGSKGSAKESTNKLYLIREEGDEAERTSKKSNQKETEDHANAKQSSSSKASY